MILIAILIGVALFFDFLNGLHDAANSVATIVSTRVLSPIYAVGWAAFFNFVAFLVFGLHVAATIGTGIIAPAVINDQVIFGALMGAIVWNVVTWLAGIPSSSSHALIGGLVGAGICKGGLKAVVWSGPGQDRGGDRSVAHDRAGSGDAADPAGDLDLPEGDASVGGQGLPPSAVHFRQRLQPGPWRQ